MNILITSAGRRVELVKAWKSTALRMLGENTKIFANDINPEISPACQIADQAFKICRCTQREYPSELLKQSIDNSVSIVIPTIDTELVPLACNYKAFQEAKINLIISDLDLIEYCKDKRLTYKFFENLSINSPRILDPKKLSFPCFVKPIEGSCGKGTRKIFNSNFITNEEIRNKNNLFQELVPDDWIEYTADLYYNKKGFLKACVPRERLETRGGEISKGITRKDNVLDFLIEHLSYLKGARGVLTIQLFTDQSRERFIGIEINPRFGGGYPMSHASGVDFPSMIISEYIFSEELNYFDSWKDNLLMLRYDQMVIVNL